jgi:hypothetical protein
VPITITEAAVVTPIVSPGGDLLIRITVDRHRICNTTSYVTILDGDGIEYRKEPDERPAFGPPGVETRVVRHMIPGGAIPGPARYRLVLEFRCDFNWTHQIWPVVLILPDLAFEIGDPPTIREGEPDG